MNYIVFDLELNSKPFKNRHPNEIIEIGAVKLDKDMNICGEFQSFVRPKIYRKLFSVVKNKTSINQEDVNNAEQLRTVIANFREWLGNEYILISWGHDDIHHLKTNCKFHRIGQKWVEQNLDMQKQFSRIYNLPSGQSSSLKNALEMLEIPITGELHRASVDAMHTAQLFIKIHDKMDMAIE